MRSEKKCAHRWYNDAKAPQRQHPSAMPTRRRNIRRAARPADLPPPLRPDRMQIRPDRWVADAVRDLAAADGMAAAAWISQRLEQIVQEAGYRCPVTQDTDGGGE